MFSSKQQAFLEGIIFILVYASIMTSSQIFERQSERDHVLHSLLIALSFTPQLDAGHIQSILAGFVKDANNYISAQKSRGWLSGQDGAILLSDKSERLVRLSQFKILQSKPEISKQSYHDLLLVRTLFLCLVHLKFEEIVEIRKQKYYDNKFIPDLTIVTQTQTLLIEIDRGKQPFSTLEDKVTGLREAQESPQPFVIIYFTDSQKTYDYFNQNFDKSQVQCVYLPSPTLAQDILDLSVSNSPTNLEETNPAQMDFESDCININPELEINTASAPKDDTQTFNSQTQKRAHSEVIQNKASFQPVQLTNPITDKPTPKATFPLAPDIFAFDSSLIEKANEPWSQEYTEALKKLRIQYLNTNPRNDFQNTLADTLRMLEMDGRVQMEENLDPEDDD